MFRALRALACTRAREAREIEVVLGWPGGECMLRNMHKLPA